MLLDNRADVSFVSNTIKRGMPLSEYESIKLRLVSDLALVNFKAKKILSGPELETLSNELQSLIQVQRLRHFLLDFSGVVFFSSAVLGVLIRFRKQVHALGGVVRFNNIDPGLDEIFGGDILGPGPNLGGSPAKGPSGQPDGSLSEAKDLRDEYGEDERA